MHENDFHTTLLLFLAPISHTALARAGLRLRAHRGRCLGGLLAHDSGSRAARARDEVCKRIRELVPKVGFVADVLGRGLGPGGQPETSKKS